YDESSCYPRPEMIGGLGGSLGGPAKLRFAGAAIPQSPTTERSSETARDASSWFRSMMLYFCLFLR
ncbi:MAG: hypothetical protein WEA31_02530, partial [Pirellulales bacterium]